MQEAAAGYSHAQHEVLQAGQVRILVVDDDRAMRGAVQDFLMLAGFRSFQEARDGAEAWELMSKILKSDNPDDRHEFPELVLTDGEMPGLSGPELVRNITGIDPAILKAKGLERPGIVAVCGHPHTFRDALEVLGVSQAIPIIEKPFEPVSLVTSVQGVLAAQMVQQSNKLGEFG